MEWIQQTDISILLFIQERLRWEPLNVFFQFITHFGDAGIFWIILAAALMLSGRTRKAGAAAFCALFLGFLLTNVALKNLIVRTRPYLLVDALVPLGTIPVDSSFPSGHTCASFSCALIYVRLLPKKFGVPLVVLAVLIAFSRLYLCVHYPTDVLGGFLVALLSSTAVYGVYQYVEKKREEKSGCA